MLDVMFTLGLMGVAAAIAIPTMHAGLDRSRGLAAARYLAGRMALARAQAVSRSANVALRFDQSGRGIRVAIFADGNGNGVRSEDIAAGIDGPVEAAVSLEDRFPGVAIALDPDVASGPAVQVGASSLLSFTPDGTATSGSVYVRSRDASQWVVRVLGTTARTRILRYSPQAGAWVQAF